MADATKDASLSRRAFKAGIFYIACQLFVRGITFLMTPVFTRLLSQEQYNQYKIFSLLASDLRTGHVALPVAKRQMCQV